MLTNITSGRAYRPDGNGGQRLEGRWWSLVVEEKGTFDVCCDIHTETNMM